MTVQKRFGGAVWTTLLPFARFAIFKRSLPWSRSKILRFCFLFGSKRLEMYAYDSAYFALPPTKNYSRKLFWTDWYKKKEHKGIFFNNLPIVSSNQGLCNDKNSNPTEIAETLNYVKMINKWFNIYVFFQISCINSYHNRH